jgi:hypothetical protein
VAIITEAARTQATRTPTLSWPLEIRIYLDNSFYKFRRSEL